MSFNQKSGKNQERKSSIKWNRLENNRKPVVVFEQKINPKSQRETNIQSCTYEETSIKQDSRFILPSIIRQKPLHDSKLSPNKSYLKSRFFTQENTKEADQEQNLFTVEQNQKSIPIEKRNLVNPWYKKLRKKQQNIILNYLNTKIETQTVKKHKRKIKKSISNQRIIEENKFLIVPISQLKRHKRNLTEFKAQKLNKIKLNQTIIHRRQSLPNYTPKQTLIKMNQISKSQKKCKIIENLKLSIQRMKKTQLQKSEHKQMNQKRKSTFKDNQDNKTSQQISFIKQVQRTQQEVKFEKRKNNQLEASKNHYQNQQQINSYLSEDSIIHQNDEQIKDKVKNNNDLKKSKSKFQNVNEKSQITKLINSMQKEADLQQEKNQKNQNQYNINTEWIQFKQWTQKLNIKKNITLKGDDQTHKENQNKKMTLKQTLKSDDQTHKENQNKFSIIDQSKEKLFLSQSLLKQFLQIKTFYAQVDYKIKSQKIVNLPDNQSFNLLLKKLPLLNQLIEFVEKYSPEDNEIKILQLMKHQNFKILFEQKKYLYFGLLNNQKKQGYGVTIKQNYLFEGFYKQDKKMKGIQINQVGKYIGEFQNNKREGKGQFFWKNGQKYTGDWINGKKHGKGIWSSPNGDMYDGQWVMGKVQGYGIHNSSNGQKYEGFFHQFLKSVRGIQNLPNGDQYQGQFSKGKPHGKGIYRWNSGQIYKCQFIQGLRHGFGTLQDGKGNVYKGFFINQEASGQCEIDFSSKYLYKGSINKGLFDGKGTLIFHSSLQEWKGLWVLDDLVERKEYSKN